MAHNVEGFPLSSGLNTWLCKLGQEWDKKNWPLKPIFWAPLCMAITRRGPKVVPWVGTDVIGQVALLWKQTRERWIGWNLENLHFDNLYPKCGFNLDHFYRSGRSFIGFRYSTAGPIHVSPFSFRPFEGSPNIFVSIKAERDNNKRNNIVDCCKSVTIGRC